MYNCLRKYSSKSILQKVNILSYGRLLRKQNHLKINITNNVAYNSPLLITRYYSSIDKAREASIDEKILNAEEEALIKDLEEEKHEEYVFPPEIGGPEGPEPTRYGDWEKNGRVSDF